MLAGRPVACSVDLEQLDLKNQVSADVEHGSLSDRHLHHAVVLALDHLAHVDRELEWRAAVLRGVELGAVETDRDMPATEAVLDRSRVRQKPGEAGAGPHGARCARRSVGRSNYEVCFM